MTQNEKDLLFKDLCARIPYRVKVQTGETPYKTLDGMTLPDYFVEISTFQFSSIDWLGVKPYLFPLSSMTEEQCEELRNLIYEHFTLDDEFNEGIRFKTYGDILVWLDGKPINECYFIFDWFNKKHFDYRGLIPKGLAIDCTYLNIY